MNLPAYPHYKPSGVEWLGDVPEHWEVKSMTRVTTNIRNGTSATQLEDDSESAVPVTRIESISGGQINFHKVGQVEWTPTLERYRLKKGDILLSHINSLSMVGNCAILDSDRPLYSGMNLLRIEPEPTIHAQWLWRALSSDGIRKEISARAKPAINQASVTTTQIKALQLPVPSLPEQRSIAAFLDRETGRVDRLVAKERELIERLKEKRTALISRTVTRGLPAEAAAREGLPANPPLKPSSLDSLGDIPSHWKAKPLKRAVGFVEGPGIMAADFMDDGVPLLRISCIGGRRATLDDCNYVSEKLATTKWAHFRVKLRDLLISGSASTGFCSEVDDTTVGAIPYTGIIIIRPLKGKADRDFIRWFFLSDLFLDQASLARTGSTILHFGPTHLSKMFIALPNLPEQAAIAAYLDAETAKLDALVGKVEAAVERVQEYRTALITAAVTGKIDVRRAVPAASSTAQSVRGNF